MSRDARGVEVALGGAPGELDPAVLDPEGCPDAELCAARRETLWEDRCPALTCLPGNAGRVVYGIMLYEFR